MSHVYEPLTAATIPAYIARQPHLSARVNADSLDVTEVGDGNLNLVFICRDDLGQSIVLKQALPYVRAAGEGWPLTPERATAEARGLRAGRSASPETSPEPYGYDEANYVIAMEDLSALTVWREELNVGHAHGDASDQCGRHIARLLASTGPLDLDPAEIRVERGRLPNTAMCEITEALVFTEPYIDHEHNSWPTAVGGLIAELRADAAYRAGVERCKRTFLTTAECLVHGDLHTGSVMVGTDEGVDRTVVIDPEFCFYGPVAFDLGALFGNYLVAAVRAAALGQHDHRAAVQRLPGGTWRGFETELRTRWAQRSSPTLTDHSLEQWFVDIRRQAISFGACKAARRMIGFAKVSDIESLPDDVHADAVAVVLRNARRWMLNARELDPTLLLEDLDA